MQSVTTRKDGNILIITVNNPPVNVLSWHVRQGLSDGINEALADDGVKAVLLICDGQTFIAGADISEFSQPDVLAKGVNFLAVLTAFENSTKPVVAAIHGTALGGGLEMALVCHYRIAVPSAKLGVPEVKLGLLPGGGGTQRLPRVVGIEQAAIMCSTGEPIAAQRALECGLVDRIANEGNLATDALAFARECITMGPRPTRDRPVTGDPGVIAKLEAKYARKWKGFDAPYANLRCVAASAVNPDIDDGLMIERAEFGKLMSGSQAKAQQYMFFSERQAAKIDGLPRDIALRDIKKVGVIGAGTMGGGISMNFLAKGIAVTIVEMGQDALDRGVGVIRKNYETSAAKGRYSSDQVEAMMAALTPSLSLDDLAGCDLIIEAVYENMDVKKDIFGKLDKICKPGAILASNTSYLDINEIASATSRPQDVVGMHFFSPANVMKLLEVVRGAKTWDDVLATVMALAKKIGKIGVASGVCPGFIGNRMLGVRQQPAQELLLAGASAEQIDTVFTGFGFPMGPFQMGDLAGMDIGWHRDTSLAPKNIREAMCAAGRFGQKNGKGFYDYDEKRNASESADSQAVIDAFRTSQGIATRTVTDQEIVERCLYPMVNEGHLILEEGIAQRASDIDVVWVYGYGWPVYRGGPMFWGELEGADKIVEALERHNIKVADSLKAKVK
jgi:3-hydroxyacyl-CoA dehydrogenase